MRMNPAIGLSFPFKTFQILSRSLWAHGCAPRGERPHRPIRARQKGGDNPNDNWRTPGCAPAGSLRPSGYATTSSRTRGNCVLIARRDEAERMNEVRSVAAVFVRHYLASRSSGAEARKAWGLVSEPMRYEVIVGRLTPRRGICSNSDQSANSFIRALKKGDEPYETSRSLGHAGRGPISHTPIRSIPSPGPAACRCRCKISGRATLAAAASQQPLHRFAVWGEVF